MNPDIFTLCWKGATADVLKLLDASPALINARDTSLHGGGYTPLLYAAYVGAQELCSELISRGATVNAANDAGCTALMLAAQQGHLGVATLLLGCGADPTRTDGTTGFSALDLAFDSPNVGALLVTGRLPPDAPPEALAAAASASVAFPVCAPPETLRTPPSLSVTACAASLRLASTGLDICPATRAFAAGPPVVALRPPLPIALDERQPLPDAVEVQAALTLSFTVSWAPDPAPVYVPAPPPQQQGGGGDSGAPSPSPRVPLPPSLFEVAILQLSPTGTGVVPDAAPAAVPVAAADPASPPMMPPARGAPPAAAAWLLAQTQGEGSRSASPPDADAALVGGHGGGRRGSTGSAPRPPRGVAAAVVFRGSVPAVGAQAQPASAATAAAYPLTHAVSRVAATLPLRLLVRSSAPPATSAAAAAAGRVPLGCDATVRFVAKVRCVNALGSSPWSAQSDPTLAAVRLTVDATGVPGARLEAGPAAAVRAAAAAVTPQASTPPRRVAEGLLPRIFDASPASSVTAAPVARSQRRGSALSAGGASTAAGAAPIDGSWAAGAAWDLGSGAAAGESQPSVAAARGIALPPATAAPVSGIGARPRSGARLRPPA